jgi:hypothetical protein
MTLQLVPSTLSLQLGLLPRYSCVAKAAKFINKRIPGATVTPHFGKIQDKDAEFYKVPALPALPLRCACASSLLRWWNILVFVNCDLIHRWQRGLELEGQKRPS